MGRAHHNIQPEREPDDQLLHDLLANWQVPRSKLNPIAPGTLRQKDPESSSARSVCYAPQSAPPPPADIPPTPESPIARSLAWRCPAPDCSALTIIPPRRTLRRWNDSNEENEMLMQSGGGEQMCGKTTTQWRRPNGAEP